MDLWIPIAGAVVAIGGFSLVVSRAARERRDRGEGPWIGGDGASGGADSGAVLWSSSDPGEPAPDGFSGAGGDFGGGGASGGWDEGGSGDGGDGGGGDGGGGDGGGGGD